MRSSSPSTSCSNPLAGLCTFVCFFGIVGLSRAESFLRASRVTLQEVQADLLNELDTGGGQAHQDRLFALEAALGSTFKALPKTADGSLNHAVVRFVLHRFFMQRHGWFIKGLEPNGPVWNPSMPETAKEWVPAYLQDYLESSGSEGIDLRKLAVLAATLEDLIRMEAHNRLEAVYSALDLPVDRALTMDQMREIIGMYMVVYLVGGNVSASSHNEAVAKLHRFQQKYTGYADVAAWSEGVWQELVPGSPWLLTQPKEAEESDMDADGAFQVSHDSATKFVEVMGERFGTFNDLECRSLKETLTGMEGPKPGRVRLKDFYSMALYSHWKFNEKVEYLRALGALDESDPKEIHVILPNYIGARPNCLEASGFYAICCRNECEDLMSYLEEEVAAPSAAPNQIADLVVAFSKRTSNMSAAQLSPATMRRLDEVAASNNGTVPLHGRLFAQWMHHVFPKECPYPHEAGTTSPQTPDEWLKETGQANIQASAEEMQCYVDLKTWLPSGGCSGDSGAAVASNGAPASNELPWSATEELLVVHDIKHRSQAVHAIGNRLRGLTLACVGSGLVLAAKMFYQGSAKGGKKVAGHASVKRAASWWVTLAFFLFPVLVLTVDYSFEAILPESMQVRSASGEALQLALAWGLLGSIVHRIITEFGLPGRKELSVIMGSGPEEKYMV
mmetsp:Transcript_31962/g.74867  ORF Transcript_31962/g.74867 Transcript_31962/m.74867 type:complete len:675 (+) Transcript_31962:80-2104(+)